MRTSFKLGPTVVFLLVITALSAFLPSVLAQESDPTDTPTPETDSFNEAYSDAYSFEGTNADWTPVERDFDGITMVLVPVGCFMMGSDDLPLEETGAFEICFDEPFWIDKTEVAQADFARLEGVKDHVNEFLGDPHPVENITWYEARDFCELRDARLPTEAEWEYAARGPDNLVYPWGNEWDETVLVWTGTSPKAQRRSAVTRQVHRGSAQSI